MNQRIIPVAVALLALAGCGSPSKYGASPAHDAGTPVGSGATLSLGDSAAGSVLKDSSGHTVYFYAKDKTGEKASTCAGRCARAWPAVAAPMHPTLGPGVTGRLGTVKGVDGKPQLTINGHPLYTFVKDEDEQDAYGQGYEHVWWVVNMHGKAVKASMGSGGAGGGGY